MNNLNESWCHDWDKEKSLYEENFLPLQSAFKNALMKIPQEKRLQMGGMLIDDLWNNVYQKHFPYQSVKIGERGELPAPNRSLLRHQRVRSSNYNGVTTKPQIDAGMERLALLIHHNCVLKPKPNESAFNQALRTVMMQNSGLIHGVIKGSYNDWEYLENKQVEPVTYNAFEPANVSAPIKPIKVPFFSKARWAKKTPAPAAPKYQDDSILITNLNEFMKGRIVKGRIMPATELTKPKVKLTIWQKIKNFKFSPKQIVWKNLNPKIWFKSQLAKFSKPVDRVATPPFQTSYNQKREKIAIEFLKSARGQV